MLEQFDAKTRKKKIFRLIIYPTIGFVIGATIVYIKSSDLLLTFFAGSMLALGLFMAEWQLIHGKRFGFTRGDRIGPTPEEEFDEAIRKMKEKGEKP